MISTTIILCKWGGKLKSSKKGITFRKKIAKFTMRKLNHKRKLLGRLPPLTFKEVRSKQYNVKKAHSQSLKKNGQHKLNYQRARTMYYDILKTEFEKFRSLAHQELAKEKFF